MKRLRKRNINTPKYYEKIWGDEYNKRPYYDAVRQRALARYVTHTGKVLDVGAGVFGTCMYLAEQTNIKAELHCVDFSYTAKEIVEKRCGDRIRFDVGRVDKLAFADNSFDCVIAGEIIEHMEDPAGFAKELCRVCRPGGVVTLSTVDTECENAKKHGEYKDHVWEFTPEDLTQFFEPYGETVYETVGDYHFISCRLPKPICITVDDFCQSNHKMPLLESIHKETGMVFNLFTIPGLCSKGFIENAKKVPWLDMIPHGWKHPHARECQNWEKHECDWYFKEIAGLGLTKGFKAPGWQISDATYVALNEQGYWVADQHYNDKRRPQFTKVHYPEAGFHFHIGHMGGFNKNEIEDNLPLVMQIKGEFGFLKDN